MNIPQGFTVIFQSVRQVINHDLEGMVIRFSAFQPQRLR
jgi:hypothetical protein